MQRTVINVSHKKYNIRCKDKPLNFVHGNTRFINKNKKNGNKHCVKKGQRH